MRLGKLVLPLFNLSGIVSLIFARINFSNIIKKIKSYHPLSLSLQFANCKYILNFGNVEYVTVSLIKKKYFNKKKKKN